MIVYKVEQWCNSWEGYASNQWLFASEAEASVFVAAMEASAVRPRADYYIEPLPLWGSAEEALEVLREKEDQTNG